MKGLGLEVTDAEERTLREALPRTGLDMPADPLGYRIEKLLGAFIKGSDAGRVARGA